MITIERKKLEQVREALATNRVMARDADGNYTREVTPKPIVDSLTAIDEALAQPEQEPAATVTVMTQGVRRSYSFLALQKLPDGVNDLYTTPPKRPWVGLTDEDYLNALDLHPYEGTDREFWKVLEAKLKEKNT